MMKSFKIVRSESYVDFGEQISKLLSEGWQLYNPMIIVPIRTRFDKDEVSEYSQVDKVAYYQSMSKFAPQYSTDIVPFPDYLNVGDFNGYSPGDSIKSYDKPVLEPHSYIQKPVDDGICGVCFLDRHSPVHDFGLPPPEEQVINRKFDYMSIEQTHRYERQHPIDDGLCAICFCPERLPVHGFALSDG